MLITMVFPAHAGMSRHGRPRRARAPSFPRSRGDEPNLHNQKTAVTLFSPLTRG